MVHTVFLLTFIYQLPNFPALYFQRPVPLYSSPSFVRPPTDPQRFCHHVRPRTSVSSLVVEWSHVHVDRILGRQSLQLAQ